jgi:hypothetical protein
MRSAALAATLAALLTPVLGCDAADGESSGFDEVEQSAVDEPRSDPAPVEEVDEPDPCAWPGKPPRVRQRVLAPDERWGHETVASPQAGYGDGACDGHLVEFDTAPEGTYRITVAHDPGLFDPEACESHSLRLAVWQRVGRSWSLVDVDTNRGGIWFIDGCYFTKTIDDVRGADALRAHASAWRSGPDGSRTNTPLAVMIERTD